MANIPYLSSCQCARSNHQILSVYIKILDSKISSVTDNPSELNQKEKLFCKLSEECVRTDQQTWNDFSLLISPNDRVTYSHRRVCVAYHRRRASPLPCSLGLAPNIYLNSSHSSIKVFGSNFLCLRPASNGWPALSNNFPGAHLATGSRPPMWLSWQILLLLVWLW